MTPSAAVLYVSAAGDNYPYSYEDTDGKVTGFAVDILDAAAARMNLTLVREVMPALDDLNRFAAGEFDVGQWHPRMPGRDNETEYSMPILVVQGAIFVRRGDRRFTTLEQLRERNARIATPTQGQAFALAHGFAPERVQMASSPECLRLLSTGAVDAALVARLTGVAQAHHLGIRNVEPVGASLKGFTVRYCIAAHHGTGVIESLNEGLALLFQTGDFERIYRKWFARYEPGGFTREQVVLYAAGALAFGLAIAVWALLRQRQLSRRLARQTEELAQNRAILAEAQQFARLGHWSWDWGSDTQIHWSEEASRIFERDSRLGAPSLEELFACARPADRDVWRKAIASAPQKIEPYALDIVIEPKPGMRKTIHVRGRPVRDATGRFTGTFGTVQDITAWRSAEESLHRTEQLLQALYDNLPLGLGAVERDTGRWLMISVNPEVVRQFGLTEKPSAGQSIDGLGLAPHWVSYWTDLFNRCAESAEPLKVELARLEQGRDYAITLVPLGRVGDRPRCCFLMEDVTERKQQDAEISQGRRLRAIGELVGGIAHEFNNLLTPILLNADQLQTDWAHLPGLREDLRVIAEAARRSAELTRRLLAFGRKSDRRVEPLDLRAVVDANVELVRHTFDRRIQLGCRVPADLPRLYLNGGDLHQILLNLLVNARDTLIEKMDGLRSEGWAPRIGIEAALIDGSGSPFAAGKNGPPAQWIRLTVRDNGCGMAPEVIDRIFEPFYTTKEVGRGTGLGLATVWHLVTEAGGRVDVESAPGEGSAFHVRLPVGRPEKTAPESPATPAPTATAPGLRLSSRAGGYRILLAEDEEMIARLVTNALRRVGHTIVAAGDGDTAWRRLEAAPGDFDAIIMDLNMPGLNGVELARRARALPFTGPLIVMSGQVTDEKRRELDELHVEVVLNKPFTVDLLQTAVAKALEKVPAVTPQS